MGIRHSASCVFCGKNALIRKAAEGLSGVFYLNGYSPGLGSEPGFINDFLAYPAANALFETA